MEGRYIDNANFFSINDINTMSDDEIYAKLLEEFPTWLKYKEVEEKINSQPDAPKKKGFLNSLFGK